jgi:hypothetical protein
MAGVEPRRAGPEVADGEVVGQGGIQDASEFAWAGRAFALEVQMGHLAQGVDARVRAPGAPEVDQVEARGVQDVFNAASHGADALLGLFGALFLPALEAAAIVFDQQPESGQGRWFHGHAQAPMTAFTALMSVAGSWIGLAR